MEKQQIWPEQDPIQRPISTSTVDDSDFESTVDNDSILTPPASHFGNSHPDLPPSYDESQAEALDAPTPSYPYPPGVVNPSDITVFRTEIPPDPIIPPPQSHNPDEKIPILPPSPSPQASGLLNEALQFTETPPPADTGPPLRIPLAVPSLSKATGSVKFARFFAPVLDSHSITAAQFVDFIDGLNAICTATSFTSTLYHSRSPLSSYEVSRDDSNIPREDMISAFLALSNTHFFNPRGLMVQMADLCQLADEVNMNNAAIRKTVLEEVLRNARAGIGVPAAANGAAGAASQALVPYIEPLTAAVPEPRKHTEALDILAGRLAATHIDVAGNPPQQRSISCSNSNANSDGDSSTDGNSLKRQQTWAEWGEQFGRKWEDWGKRFGENQEKYWRQWGENQEKKWGSWGENLGKSMSAGPPWSRGPGMGFGAGRSGTFGGHGNGPSGGRGGGPFGGQGNGPFGRRGSGPSSGRGPFGGDAQHGSGPFGGGFGPFGGRREGHHGSRGGGFGRGGGRMGMFNPHGPFQPHLQHAATTPAPYGIVPGHHATPMAPRGLFGVHAPPPLPGQTHGVIPSGSNPFTIRGDMHNEHDDAEDDDQSDTASIASTSSSSSSDSDATYANEDPEAIFAAKVADIERMATEARSNGTKESHIQKEQTRRLYQASQEKTRRELRIQARTKKAEYLTHGKRAWKSGKKAEYMAWKKEAKEGRKAIKKEMKCEYRAWKSEMRKQKIEDRERYRQAKREGKMKVKKDWHAKKKDWVHGRGNRGSSVGGCSENVEGDGFNEDTEVRAKEMLWIVVNNME